MSRRKSWLIILLLGSGRCLGQVQVAVSSGYERENFHWSIAGNSAGQDPNIYSELKWQNAGGVFAGVDIKWKVWKRWVVLANGRRTFTHSGSMTDTDYGLDNRHDVLYHEEFPVTGGYSEAGSVGLGYALIDCGSFELMAFAGYGVNKQHFPVTDAGGLNSSYDGKWLGPFVRVEGVWRLGTKWRIESSVRYDQVVYRGVADWNLIAQFSHPVSFRHRADGFGITGEAGVSYVLNRHLLFSLKGNYFDWETGTGIDELYLASGSTSKTQLNEVVRSGFGVGVGVVWKLSTVHKEFFGRR